MGPAADVFARVMGKTVGRYLDQASERGLEPQAMVTDEIAGAVGKQVQARPLPPPSEAWQTLTGRRSQIEAWLDGDPPLRLVRVHELLARAGMAVGYALARASREPRVRGGYARPN